MTPESLTLEALMLKLFAALSPLFLSLLGWLAFKASQLINAKVENECLRATLLRLNDAVFTAVREIEQTLVSGCKSESADGKLSFDQQEQARQGALNAVKGHLGERGLSEIARVLGIERGGVEPLLSCRIEAAVHALRVANPDTPRAGKMNSDLPAAA